MKKLLQIKLLLLLFATVSIGSSAGEVYSLSELKNANTTSDLVIKDGYKVQILVNNGYDIYLWDGSSGICLLDGAYNALNKPAGTMITSGTIKCYASAYPSGAFERSTITDITTTAPEDFIPPMVYEAWEVDQDKVFDYVKVKGVFCKETSEWGYTYYCIKDDYNTLAVSNSLNIDIDLEEFVGKNGYFTLIYYSSEFLAPLNANFFEQDVEQPVEDVAIPEFSLSGGEVEKGTKLSISQPQDAMIVYTVDGTIPSYANNNGCVYEEPITIDHDMTVKAIAVADDERESEVAEVSFTVIKPGDKVKVALWSEDWSTGEYGDYVKYIENANAIYSMQEEMNVYYTEVRTSDNAGGESPELFMPRYAGKVEHFVATINLKGVFGNMSLSFKSTDDINAPTITISSPTEGVVVNDVTPVGCKIYVPEGTEKLQLVFGNTKTTKGGIYFDDFLLTGEKDIASEPVHVDMPAFSPESGEVEKGTKVTISQPEAAMIIYTVDGTIPSFSEENGYVYESPIRVNNDMTIKAIAVDNDGNESDVAEVTYTILVDDMITLWYEDWSSASGATTDLWPSEVNNPDAVYSMNKEQPVYIGTKQTDRAGGDAPELALPKQSRNEQWIADVNLKGFCGEMKLSYFVNKLEGLSITTETQGVTIGEIGETSCTVNVSEPIETVKFIFANNSDEYIYIDNIRLKSPRPEPIDITLTIGKGGYATLYYGKYNVMLPEESGLSAATYSLNDGKLQPETVFDYMVFAGYAVVVKGNEGTYTLKGELVAPDDVMPYLSYGDLRGTDNEEITQGNGLFYKFADQDEGVGFYLSDTTPAGQAFINKAHEAYLTINGTQIKEDTPIAYLLNGDIITTVNTVSCGDYNIHHEIFNLAGQRINKSMIKKGIYIIDGKKVVK